MTLEELDKALEKTGLDLSNPPDMEARNRVLARYGRDILASKSERCAHCWHRENNRCTPYCSLYSIPSDPVEASIQRLSKPNDIQIFPFICTYMVPVYEEMTGQKNVLESIAKEYKRRWKQKQKQSQEQSQFGIGQ